MVRTENEAEGTIRYDHLTDEEYAAGIVTANSLGMALEYGVARKTNKPYIRLGPDNITPELVMQFEQDVFGGQ